MELRSITLRLSTETYDRHERAARAAGLTTTAHLAALVEAVDPADVVTSPSEDEVASMRARQIAALEAAGVLDDGARLMLQPSRLPPQLERALAQAKRGGPGMKFYGTILGGLLRSLLPNSGEVLDEIAKLKSRPVASARLGEHIRENISIVLDALERRHEAVVLDAALDALAVSAESCAS
jgi:hypothetical protein